MSSSRRAFSTAVLTISLLLILNSSVFADLQVVSPEGNGFDSIQAAVNRAGPGDTLLIKSGSYRANLTIDKSLTLKGEDASMVTIRSKSRGSPVLKTGPSKVEITLVNLTLKGATGEFCKDRAKGVCPAGLSVTGQSAVKLVDSQLVNSKRDGLRLSGSGRAVLKDSKIGANDRYGMWMGESSSATISNTSITNNRGGVAASMNSEIVISASEVSSSDGYGISLFGNSKLELANSSLSENGEGGIRLENSSSGTLKGNSLVKNDGRGLLIQSSASASLIDNKIQENQIGITNHSNGSVVLKTNEIAGNTIDFTGDLSGKSRIKFDKYEAEKISLPDEKYPDFQAALDAILPGGAIVLEDDIKGGALIDKRVTIKSEDETTRLSREGKTIAPALSLINGGDLTLLGVEVTGSGGSGIVLGGSAQLKIYSSTVKKNGSEGIGLWNSSRLTLTKTRIENNGGSGIRLVDSSGATLTGGNVAGNKVNGVLAAGSSRVEISESILSDNEGNGLFLSGNSEALANKVKIATNGRNGVKMTGESSGYFNGCLLSENGGAGINLLSSSRASIEGGDFSNNSSGISASDETWIEVSDSVFLGNEIGIEIGGQGHFEGRVGGSGNEFTRNDRDLTGAPESVEERLID
jgi:parallel beta-helix repeat protein